MASRQRHYLEVFCPEFKLHTNPFLDNVAVREKNLAMGSYTVFLCLGNNLVCRSILSTTIRGYLDAVEKLFLANKKPSPFNDEHGKEAECIEKILKEQHRWEKLPPIAVNL